MAYIGGKEGAYPFSSSKACSTADIASARKEFDTEAKRKDFAQVCEDKIEEKFNASKKKKPQAFDVKGTLEKIQGKDPVILKKMKMPPCDKMNQKINGISWGRGDFCDRLAYARQDHMIGVMDVTKNNGVYGIKANWTQCIALHPSKDLILTGGMDNATTMWQKSETPGKLKEITKMIEHDGYISSLEFLDDGSKYISSGGDAESRIFDVESRKSIVRFCGHSKDAQGLTFPIAVPGWNTFATCSSDKTVKVWDVRAGICTHTFLTDSELNSCAMFPNGNMVACGGEKDKTYLFDIRSYKLLSKYARNNQKTASVGWSKSGRCLYVGHDDGAMITWDIFNSGENKQYASKVPAHTEMYPGTDKPNITHSRVQCIRTNEDGVVATGGFDGGLCIWTAPKDA